MAKSAEKPPTFVKELNSVDLDILHKLVLAIEVAGFNHATFTPVAATTPGILDTKRVALRTEATGPLRLQMI